MKRLRNNRPEADVKTEQEDVSDNPDRAPSGYYYDDTTGYEIYRDEDGAEDQETHESET